jgi:hypothetical protein
MNITLQTQDGIGGGPELVSKPWTANAGDTVLVMWAVVSGGGPPQLMTLATAGYTWHYSPTFMSADTDITMQGAWALNVPAGTQQFSTSGLGFSAVTYFVFTISGPNTQDQLGTSLFPNPAGGPASEITTAGSIAQTGEAAFAWMQAQYSTLATTITAMSGWTTTPVQTNTANSVNNGAVSYNANAGTAGQPLTGGWSAFTNSSGNNIGGQGILATFAASGVVGLQPGFPKSGRIEEPSEGMQQSNVTPPDMGTEQ